MAEERSPAFRFYARDFLADERVARMSDAEIGMYVRLMCYAWLEGSIPGDPAAIADLLPRTTARDFTRSWERILKSCFTAHPSRPGRLVQSRLEREREKQRENRKRRTEAGRKGAAARWPSDGKRIANASQPDSEGTADGVRGDGLASAFALASSETHSAGAREALDRVSPGIALGVWFVVEGVKAGAIPAHHKPIASQIAYKSIEIANGLLAAYELDEIKTRALRFFARRLPTAGRRRIGAAATLEFLSRNWGWFESDDSGPGGSFGSRGPTRPLGDNERQLLDELRTAEATS